MAREWWAGQALPQLPVGPVPLLEAALAARLGARFGARPGVRPGARIVQGREEGGWLQQGLAAETQAQLAAGSVQSRNGISVI